MRGSFRAGLRRRAAATRRRIAFPEVEDPRVAAAVAALVDEGLVQPVVVGPASAARAALEAAGVPRDAVDVVDPTDHPEPAVEALLESRGDRIDRDEAIRRAVDPLMHAVLAVRRGVVAGCVAGAAHTTADVLRAALHGVGPAEGIATVSSAFYMSLVRPGATEETTLTFTDCGVVPDPTADQLAQIAESAVRARRVVVGDEPRVAFLSYSTRGSAGGPSPERVRAALDLFRQRMPDVAADGELQGDAALVPAVGERKAPGSEVAGRANILVFPDLDAANLGYKLVERLAGAEAIGPVLQGLRLPVVDLSRGVRTPEIVDAACVTALLADA